MDLIVFILGRHPALSRAELAAVFPAMRSIATGREFLIATGVPFEQIDIRRLGGVVKVGRVFAETERFSVDTIVEHLIATRAGEGKLLFGASVYPSSGSGPDSVKTLLIGAKKALKEGGISARFANNGFVNLTSAQSELAVRRDGGVEILALTNGRAWWYAATTAVQPFDEFKTRDYAKAVRDAHVGMLPPKLAQMMVNLGVRGATARTMYDPFCGTGTILLEAGLMGHRLVGSDIAPRMIEAAEANVAQHHFAAELFVHDAARVADVTTDVVVTEGFLGPAVSRLPEPRTRAHIFEDLARLYGAFFRWIRAERVVLTLPAYVEKGKPTYFSSEVIRPAIEKAGWRDVTPRSHDSEGHSSPLVYFRPDQVVAREVTVWERI